MTSHFQHLRHNSYGGGDQRRLQSDETQDEAAVRDPVAHIDEVAETKPVLHGRKASTYLRIFRDDEVAADDKDEIYQQQQQQQQQQQHKQLALDLRPVLPSKHNRVSKALQGKNVLASFPSSLASLRHLASSDRRASKLEGNEPGEAENLELFDAGHDIQDFAPDASISTASNSPVSADSPTSKDLQLTPISSATYYPHKSKEPTVGVPPSTASQEVLESTGSAISSIGSKDQQSTALITTPSNNAKRLEPANVVQPELSEETIVDQQTQDSHDNEDDDDDDGQNYPLAVELQPFTNTVGGHTAIFRFSKRAVCKALVNRENKWYESMELYHQELLQFMPRYIGVLNVRQHFRSKEDFLRELSKSKRKRMRQEELEKQLIASKLTDSGHELTHVQSTPAKHSPLRSFTESCTVATRSSTPYHATAQVSSSKERDQQEFLLPEVVLNDNKHIIPNSLWCQYTHSPSTAQNDSYIHYYPHSLEDGDEIYQKYKCDSGSTNINTKLQELVLQEVFAPNHLKKNKAPTSPKASEPNASLATLPSDRDICTKTAERKGMSPLLNKSVQEGISNAVDSSYSVMDLKQLHRKELAREKIERTKSNKDLVTRTPLSPQPSSLYDENVASSVISPLSLADRSMYNGPCLHQSPSNKDPSGTNNNNNESVTFEEHSDTIVLKFILLEDLTRKLKKPCVLDLKMGTRQYGVDAKRSKQLSQREKCLKTTSRKLGARICGLKIWNQNYYIRRDKYFGRRVKIGWQFTRVLARFFYDGVSIASVIRQIPILIKQLDTLAAKLVNLKGYRLYGASLLVIYDGSAPSTKRCEAKVNLIDFAKSVTKEDLVAGYDSFRIPPASPESEDRGFLRGIRSLKFYLISIWNYLTNDAPVCSTDDNERELHEFMHANQDKFSRNWDWLDEFDQEDEAFFNDPHSELRKKWRKYELIFDIEPRYNNDGDVSD